MAKDAYYFSHDSNAKDDPKCVLLIEQLGLEGYGIFWVLIETLRDQPDYKYPLELIPALSRRYNTTAEKMKTVVLQYNLFSVTEEGEFFFSESLNNRMESLSLFRESQRKKALKRWNNAPALPRQSHGNADPMPVKESKVKKSKVNNKENIKENIFTDDFLNHRFSVSLETAIAKWLTYKKERKQTYKETGMETLIKKIKNKSDECGEQAVIDLIDLCISQNWSGIIWDKIEKGCSNGANEPARDHEKHRLNVTRL